MRDTYAVDAQNTKALAYYAYKASINVFPLYQEICVTGFTYVTINNVQLL